MPKTLVHILVTHRGATDTGKVAGDVIENTAFLGPSMRRGIGALSRRLRGLPRPPPVYGPPLSRAMKFKFAVRAAPRTLGTYALAVAGAQALGRAGYGRLSQGKNYGQELVNYTPALGWRGYLDHAKLAYKYWDKSLGEIWRMFAGK